MDWTLTRDLASAFNSYQVAKRAGNKEMSDRRKQNFFDIYKVMMDTQDMQAKRQEMVQSAAAEARTAQLHIPKLGQEEEAHKQAEQETGIGKIKLDMTTEEYNDWRKYREEKERVASEMGETPFAIQAREELSGAREREKKSELGRIRAAAEIETGVPEIEAGQKAAAGRYGTEMIQALQDANAAEMAAKAFVAANQFTAEDAQNKVAEIQSKQKSGYYDQLWAMQQKMIPLLEEREQAEINRLNREASQASATTLRYLRQIEMEDKMRAYIDVKYGEGYYDEVMANQMLLKSGTKMKRDFYIGQFRILATVKAGLHSTATVAEIANAINAQSAQAESDDVKAGVEKAVQIVSQLLGGGAGAKAALSDKQRQNAIKSIDRSIDSIRVMAKRDWPDFNWEGFLEPVSPVPAELKSEIDNIYGGVE